MFPYVVNQVMITLLWILREIRVKVVFCVMAWLERIYEFI